MEICSLRQAYTMANINEKKYITTESFVRAIVDRAQIHDSRLPASGYRSIVKSVL